MFPSLRPSLTSLLHRLRPLVSSSHFSENDLKKIERIVEELKEVQKIWERIDAVLADAEERQIREESVHLWLRDLRDLADQIEHLRDVYEYEVVARDVEASKATSSSHVEVRPSQITSLSPLVDASFREQIDTDIRRIKKAFNSIARRRGALHLKQAEADDHKFSFTDDVTKRETTSHRVVDRVFLGRDRELQQVRDLLIGDGHRNVEVIVVMGMGGIGKTTLAQHVCKDPQVVGNFNRIGWVHVPENFDVIRLTKAIVETFSGDSSLNELSSLQDEVVGLIKDEKVLLVMDDVWYIDNWESFLAPFDHGARKGSKILVTTRLPEVAIAVRAVDSIKLSSLSEEDGWLLLKKHAFPNQSNDVGNLEELEEIGKRIVEKCGGLPLSIKLLGSLLRYKENDENEWRDVMESTLLDLSEGSEAKQKILGSLYLSYLYLSPKLKSCFKFCAIYPKENIAPRRLKYSWMACDLVNDEKEATRCFNELESRCFLEFDGLRYFLMHDHIYDLAKYVSGEEHVNLEYKGTFPEQVDGSHFSSAQHASVSFQCNKASSPCHINTTLANLRTLKMDTWSVCPEVRLSPGQYLRELNIDISFMTTMSFFLELTSCDGCQDQLKCLRMLALPGVHGSIPAWVSRLYNLRYLKLYGLQLDCLLDCVCDLRNLRWLIVELSGIRYLPEAISRLSNLQELNLKNGQISSLPKSVSELVNLQELNLYGCRGLTELPDGIINLTNLRILNLQFTGISFLPRGFGALTKLEYLTYYVSSTHAGLAELKNMKYLKDVMIENLCEVVNEEDAVQAQMATKKCIRKLHLHWSKYAHKGCLDQLKLDDVSEPPSYYNVSDMLSRVLKLMGSEQAMFQIEKENEEKVSHREERVLEQLRPHRNVEKVFISNYRGFKLPSWMGDDSFTKLVTLQLYEINHCISLSPIDQLPSLVLLLLEGMDRLKELVSNRRIKDEDIDIMDSATEKGQSFPKLRHLYIYHCKRLELLPLHKFSSLEYVRVHRCLNLQYMEPPYDIPCSLKLVDLDGCPKFQFSPDPHFPQPSWQLNNMGMVLCLKGNM